MALVFDDYFYKYFASDSKDFTKQDLELFFELGKRSVEEMEEKTEAKIYELIGKLEGALRDN